MAERTNADWESFIQAKILEVLSFDSSVDSQPTHLASVTNANDPRFPLAIDHTLLKQDATPAQIDVLCDEAIEYGFKVRTPSHFLCTANAPPTNSCFLGYHLLPFHN
jgi:deoxyribose-phosphate aldolase